MIQACMRAALFLLALTTTSAYAEVARVRGGEHWGFTRITVAARDLDSWRFGRDGQTYELQVSEVVSSYDLSRAFDRISQTRLARLWRDPVRGTLRIALACNCHALAYNAGRGLIAIDLRDGPAPPTSAFERPLRPASLWAGGLVAPNLWNGRQSSQFKSNYDWLTNEIWNRRQPEPQTAQTPVDPLRDALLRQVGQAIAQGLIAPTDEIISLSELGLNADSTLPAVRVIEGDIPGISLSSASTPDAKRNHRGELCLTDSAIDLASWASDAPAAEQIGPLRLGLIGEFDAPDNSAILRAARGLLTLGFGAEAREALSLLVKPSQTYHQPLQSLSYLIDLEHPPVNAFARMESCDSDVALWAALALALSADTADSFPAKGAILRGYSNLPLHLRRALGPTLVDYFINRKDTATAQALRDALLRNAAPAEGEVALMDAELEFAKGDTERARDMATPLIHDTPAQAAMAAVLVAESAFSGRQIVAESLREQLDILGVELQAGPEEKRLLRAKMLTSAMLGDFDTAFHWRELVPENSADLWSLAAEAAPDDVFLPEAVKAAADGDVLPQHALPVAKRLLAYGFADAALAWLGPLATTGGTDARLLAAQAAIATRDARLAYAILSGVAGDEAALLRARAAMRLGDMARALELMPASAEKEALVAAMAANDWDRLSKANLPGWSDAASLQNDIAPPPAYDEGPLAEAKRLTEQSATTRAAIEKLITETKF